MLASGMPWLPCGFPWVFAYDHRREEENQTQLAPKDGGSLASSGMNRDKLWK